MVAAAVAVREGADVRAVVVGGRGVAQPSCASASSSTRAWLAKPSASNGYASCATAISAHSWRGRRIDACGQHRADLAPGGAAAHPAGARRRRYGLALGRTEASPPQRESPDAAAEEVRIARTYVAAAQAHRPPRPRAMPRIRPARSVRRVLRTAPRRALRPLVARRRARASSASSCTPRPTSRQRRVTPTVRPSTSAASRRRRGLADLATARRRRTRCRSRELLGHSAMQTRRQMRRA